MVNAFDNKVRATRPIATVPSVEAVETRVDLREMFPQSIRLAFEESFAYLIGLFLITAGYIWFATSLPVLPEGPSLIGSTELVLRWFFYIAVTICGGKLLYELIYFLVYRYTIELEHLTITRGVLFRTRTSFPIAKINDVSLRRNPIEILFGVYNLTILTASPVANSGTIEGLPARSAHGLQSYLLALVETTLPDVREKVAENVLERAEAVTVSSA